jgi:hypothetical protein
VAASLAGIRTTGTLAAVPQLQAPAPPAKKTSAARRLPLSAAAVKDFFSSRHGPLRVLVLVSVLSLVTRLAWITKPRVLLFDENYYVNAARRMLGIRLAAEQIYATSPAGLDPNFAHPPLGKLLISMGIRSFGDNPFGWRFASILFGSYAILALYWLARSAGFSSWVAVGASSLMAADTMFFIHGRIGTLEILVLTFMLVGCAVYLGGRPALAGLILGLGACVKLVGFFALLAIGVLELSKAIQRMSSPELEKFPILQRLRKALSGKISVLALTAGTALASYLGVLYLLDLRFTNFDNPVEHTIVMVTSIQDSGLDNSIVDIVTPRALVEPLDPALAAEAGPSPGPQPLIRQRDQTLYLAPHSAPWEWLANRKAISYYRSPTNRGEVRSWSQFGLWTSDAIHFNTLVNPAIIFLAIPALAYTSYLGWRRRSDSWLLPLAWFVAIFGCFLVIYYVRPTAAGHIYYMVVVMPAVYLAVAQMFSTWNLAARLRPYYSAIVVAAFFLYFPFKTWGGL